MTVGICPHGEFELEKGCSQCIAERRVEKCQYRKPRPDTVDWCDLDESVCALELHNGYCAEMDIEQRNEGKSK